MKFKKIFIVFFSILTVFIANSFSCCFADKIDDDAEILYTKMKRFLSDYSDVNPEEFDDVCRQFMSGKIPETNLLGKQDFEEKSKNNIVLYRGVSNKEYADRFKQGEVFLSRWNVRGSGIYTTTSLGCAKLYANKINPDDALIKLFILRGNTKILDNKYLEKLKEIIIKKHGEEFGEFEGKHDNEYIFDSMASYINRSFAEIYINVMFELSEMNLSDEEYLNKEMELFNEKIDKLKSGLIYQKFLSKRKKYYTSNKAYVWFNSGLLTKLMGFDVLYTYGSLRENYSAGNEEEYLVVNPNVLNVLRG